MATDSSPLVAEDENEDALREAMILRENVKRLQALAGVESNMRNMEAEDEAVRRDLQIGQALYGVTAELGGQSGDPMRATAARDVIVNINRPEPTVAPATTNAAGGETAPTEPVAQPQAGLSTLAKAAVLGSAVLGGSGVTAAVLNYVNQPGPPAITEVIDGKEYGIKGYVDQLPQ